MNSEVAPAVSSALEHVGRVLANAEHLLSPDEPVHRELRRVMREMSEAARSLRVMADYLEQHPEALIYGREDEP
jgi:paraquat-inducible protein B